MCQETSPETSEGPVPSNLDLTMESQPPVIHDIVTSSPSDNEQLEATPFVTSIGLGVPLDVPTSVLPPVQAKEPSLFPVTFEGPATEEQASDIHAGPAAAAEEGPADTTESEVETLAAGPPARARAEADMGVAAERREPPLPTDDRPATETVGAEEETTGQKEDPGQAEIQEEMEEDEEEDEEGTA